MFFFFFFSYLILMAAVPPRVGTRSAKVNPCTNSIVSVYAIASASLLTSRRFGTSGASRVSAGASVVARPNAEPSRNATNTYEHNNAVRRDSNSHAQQNSSHLWFEGRVDSAIGNQCPLSGGEERMCLHSCDTWPSTRILLHQLHPKQVREQHHTDCTVLVDLLNK